MQPVLDFLSTPHGIVAAVLFCALAALATFRLQALEVSERKWCAEVATWEASLGLSDVMTSPWKDLASGDFPNFAGAMRAKIKYLSDAGNREKELINVLRTLYSTPSGKLAIDKTYADLAGGAPAEQLAGDAASVVASAPAGPGLGPIASRVKSAASTIQQIADTPSLAGPLGILHALGLPAELEQGISALFGATHQIGAQSAASATPALPGSPSPSPSPSPAPAPAPQSAAVTLPPGHTALLANTAPGLAGSP